MLSSSQRTRTITVTIRYLLKRQEDGSWRFCEGSMIYMPEGLEATYEALATIEVLGIGAESDVKTSTCKSVVDTLSLPTSTIKDLFFGLRVSRLLKCELSDGHFMAITARVKDSVKDANSLLDFYYSIGSLIDIKGQTSEVDVNLENAGGIFRSIKALSQSDRKWLYSSNNPESSAYAADNYGKK